MKVWGRTAGTFCQSFLTAWRTEEHTADGWRDCAAPVSTLPVDVGELWLFFSHSLIEKGRVMISVVVTRRLPGDRHTSCSIFPFPRWQMYCFSHYSYVTEDGSETRKKRNVSHWAASLFPCFLWELNWAKCVYIYCRWSCHCRRAEDDGRNKSVGEEILSGWLQISAGE